VTELAFDLRTCLWVIGAIFAFTFVRYVAISGLYYLVAYRWLREWFAPRKHDPRYPDRRTILAELKHGDWLREVEKTSMTKCYKLVCLDVLLEGGSLLEGLSEAELAARSYRFLARSPELRADIDGVRELDVPDLGPTSERWLTYWRKNPINAWIGGQWFEVDDAGRFAPTRLEVADAAERTALEDLTRELVDYRLAQYRARSRAETEGVGAAFEAKVLWNKRDPILKLPSREARPDLPEGETDVRLPTGEPWRFRFKAKFINVARPVGAKRNQLPDLLRGWFGPSAGRPGTAFHVRFAPSPDGWWLEPLGSRTADLSRGAAIPGYPTLRAAAGATGAALDAPAEVELVRLPTEHDPAETFAVRAVGRSMEGGPDPIRPGDWVVLRWARGRPLAALEGRVALVGREHPPPGGPTHHLKRIAKTPTGVELRSDHPAEPPIPAAADYTALAVLEAVVRPEDLGPPVGTTFPLPKLAEAFGLPGEPRRPHDRLYGHLFALLEGPAALTAPDRARLPDLEARPGETAFLCVRSGEGGTWRYCGVARRLADLPAPDAGPARPPADAPRPDPDLWAFPALDLATWREWAGGRGVSRTLPPAWLERAEAAIEGIHAALVRKPTWVEARGKKCRVVGRSAKGGLRIDGGPDGFKERTVSPTDVGWVLRARAAQGPDAPYLDEAQVNRLRYVEGTPKSSTRWIDTGWALVLTEGLE